MARLWLTLHVLGAIALFGPAFSFPIIGTVARKGGDVKTILRIHDAIAKKLLIPADVVMPVTGVLLIVSRDWDPFDRSGRWLLSAIILFVIMAGIGNLVQVPTQKKALAMAERNDFGPEFGKLIQKQAKVGALLGTLLLTIAVLMVSKPGL